MSRVVGPLRFCLDASQPQSRHLAVTMELAVVDDPACGDSLELFLPTWTPGSYLIREFARHLGRVTASDGETGVRLACRKSSKNRFAIAVGRSTRRLRIDYSVYAHELSVRTADLTAEHGYWNHACVLLWPVGHPGLRAEITVRKPPAWRVACGLPRRIAGGTAAPWPAADAAEEAGSEVTLLAENLEAAMDAPCLVGTGRRVAFEVNGVQHAAVLDGLGSVPVPTTLARDLGAVVAAGAAVFGGRLPYQQYLFLCLFAADGHGGLEHGDSTTLLASRTAFRSDKGYREFLSLAAHELFHAWNVKRMRPAEFWSYDYESENYTELLWLIEGWTAYYDDLLCLRAGIFSVDDYLAAVARNLSGLRSSPGRFQLSLAESSFDAWIRLYRPDENTKNSSQNYYGNGAVAAMCLDLLLRSTTAGRSSLDDVLRTLYAATFAAGRGYTREDVHAAVATVGGAACVEALQAWTEGALDPDLDSILAAFGLKLVSKDAGRPFLGLTFDAGRATVASVQAGAPAHEAGIAPGDEILALADLRVDAERWSEVFHGVAVVGQPMEVLLSRRGVIGRVVVVPSAGLGTPVLEIDPAASAAAVALRDGWLSTQRGVRA